MRISGSTILVGVIGNPVKHSLSPVILNAAFREAKINWVYTAFETPEEKLADAIGGIRALGIAGLSVTMPHKAKVCSLLDEISDSAQTLNAVNCIVNDAGKLEGHNTDGDGFLDAVKHDAGLDVAGKKVLVVGSGGSARSIIHSLGKAGAAEIAVINRTKKKALDALELAGPVGRYVEETEIPEVVSEANLVINATPIGMLDTDDTANFPIEPNLFSKGQLAIDLIYHPISTPWMEALRDLEVEAHGGLSMLIFQAARAFKLWTGKEAPVDAMRKAAMDEIENKTQ
ncbi:MAG: shikimate dehydrogenase [Acidimicrobiales bacterium]|nr:shikimate dehydrogenase [Acidimicrobiales bacterium]|tara:strand:+ start:925 stop:1782 length:858 start_codon:yes stop_codon:yes gene_type:complete